VIHWFSVSVPVFIPSSGFVLLWLLGGLVAFIYFAIKLAGVREMIWNDAASVSIVRTGLLILLWPIVTWALWDDKD